MLICRPGVWISEPEREYRLLLDTETGATYSDAASMCLVFDADWLPALGYGDGDLTCDLDSPMTIVLRPQGAALSRWSCHGDVFWPVPLGAISYGSEWFLAGYTCAMATDGVRCDNGAGQGFHVRRAQLTLSGSK